jgi:hypothetical protein
MSLSTASLSFPKPILTQIIGKPNNSSLAILQQELYENARAIHSNRGGGLNGYLAILMPPDAYLARTNVAFEPPIVPPAVVHGANATQHQMTEANRAFDKADEEFKTYCKVVNEMKRQLIAAVDPLYLAILKDRTYGFADVDPATMLAHLKLTYGENSQFAREQNRNQLSDAWNPDEPIENLWNRIANIRTYAAEAGQPIAESDVIELTLSVFEHTGVFSTAYDDWRKLDEATWTLALFMTTFTAANTERLRRLTIKTAGYHGANAAAPATPSKKLASKIQDIAIDGSTKTWYCWSHGSGINPEHTSRACKNKKEGHKDDATLFDRKGGNNQIGFGKRGQTPTPHQAAAADGAPNDE